MTPPPSPGRGKMPPTQDKQLQRTPGHGHRSNLETMCDLMSVGKINAHHASVDHTMQVGSQLKRKRGWSIYTNAEHQLIETAAS